MYSSRALESAKTMTFAAILILVVFFLFGCGLLAFLLGYLSGLGQVPNVQPRDLQIASIVFSIMFLFGLMWIFLNYFFIYRPLSEGIPERAYSPALVLGILELIFGGIIPGILLILAYSSIGSAIVYKEMQEGRTA